MKIILSENERKKVDNLFKTMEKNIENADSMFFDVENNYIDNATLLDVNEYINNPYNKTIKINGDIKLDEYKLTYGKLDAFTPFIYKDNTIDDKYIEYNELGYFDKDYSFLSLMKNDSIWMLLTAHEINTMKDSIDEAFGNVLVLGLGLGYYSFMASNKKEVKKVTVIENDKKIIKLFKENLLNQFPNKDKIEIICDDAFKYVDKSNDYDYMFADLWHDCDDGLKMYIDLLKKSAIRSSYWIEQSMLIVARRLLVNLLYEKINNIDANYEKEENYFDHIINQYNKILVNYEINSYKDIQTLLSNETIKELLVKVK